MIKFINSQLTFASVFILLSNCFNESSLANPRGNTQFDGGDYFTLYEGKIQNTVFYTDNNSHEDAIENLNSVMHMVEGQLKNENNTYLRIPTIKYKINEINRTNNSFYKINFSATFDIAVSNDLRPNYFNAIVPSNISKNGLASFEEKYKEDCSGREHPFWYDFTPNARGCALSRNRLPSDAKLISLTLNPSSQNTSGKHPEYSKLWQDGKLEVTYVAGNTANMFLESNLIIWLTSIYGQPISTNFTHLDNWTLEDVTFQVNDSLLVIHRFYFESGNVANAPASFIAQFSTLAADSDFIAYNGHAGIGLNVNAFLSAAQFKKDRYYLFWINACQPFVYLQDEFFNRVSQVNQGTPWSKNLDLMTFVRIGTFDNGSDIFHIVQELVNQSKTFSEILNPFQGAAVLGEEDNP